MADEYKLTDHVGYMVMPEDPAQSGPVVHVPRGGTWVMVQRDDIMLAPAVRDWLETEVGTEVAAVLYPLEVL